LIAAHLRAAEAYAELSHSRRAKVGAVIVKDHRVISVGYNGMPTGWENNCEHEITWPGGHVVGYETKKEVLHAEMNALMFAARNGIATEGSSLVITLMPCFECSKSIFQAGIRNVFYRDAYRDESGIEFLRKCGVHVAEARTVP
jgi:dCMP deaminase